MSSTKDAYQVGKERVEWVYKHMPVMQQIRQQYEKELPFRDLKIAICLHLEPKTANLGLNLKAGGAEVIMCPSNPLSTQDSTVTYLKQHLTCFGERAESPKSYQQNMLDTLDHKPDLIIDDGAQLIVAMHRERRELFDHVIGLSEETTGGVNIIQAIERKEGLHFPCIGVNNADMKHLFDNRYGTGQSTVEGLLAATNLTVCGKVVTVAGYGWVGKGVAMRMQGLGAEVIVTEIDPIKAIEARMDSFKVMPMQDAAQLSDFIITATGELNVVDEKDYKLMKDKCILSNVGHFNNEINIQALRERAIKTKIVRADVEEFIMPNNKSIYLLANGELVNIAIGQGHPAEIMDMTFALQSLAPKYLLENRTKLKPQFYPMPDNIDQQVAKIKLQSLNIKIDQLTSEQLEYRDAY